MTLTRILIPSAGVAVFMGLSLACGFLNPAGSKLAEAEKLLESEDYPAAILAYEGVLAAYPESDESQVAQLRVEEARLALAGTDAVPAGEALALTLLVADSQAPGPAAEAAALLPDRYGAAVAAKFEEAPWDAGVLAAEGMKHSATTLENFGPIVAGYRDDSPETTDKDIFATGYAWTIESEKPQLDRVMLGITLIKESDGSTVVSDAIGPYLRENTPTAFGPLCAVDPSTLDDVATLEETRVICEAIIEFAPDSQASTDATSAVARIDERIGAIKSSPAYRTAAALQACRDWFAWVKPRRRSIRTQEQAWRFQEEIERRGPRELEPALDYLRRRMDSMSDRDDRYRLMRQIDSACGQ